MVGMIVKLVWKKEILASASFTEIQFWTEYSEGSLVGLKDANGADLLELRFWLEEQEDGQGSEFLEQEIIGV